MSLDGRTALVTGASRGLGRAIARRLAQDGASVALNYVKQAQQAESLAAELGSKAFPVQADAGDPDQVERMVKQVEQQLGPIDILVNNAGIFRKGDLGDFDYSQMEELRRTNVDSVVHVTRAVTAGMKQRRFGRIVNLSSIAASGTVMQGTTFYAATKAAVTVLTRRFALELGPYGITVNAIAPGFILTEMASQGRTPEELKELVDRIAALAMVRRVGCPEDIAHAVSFLVSPEAGFLTGQLLTVDGGRMDYIAHP